MTIDATATSIQPTGLARTLLGVTLFFTLSTSAVIVLRCYARLRYRIFGVDDGLMLIGWMLSVGVSGIVARSTFAGVGTKDIDLNAYLQRDGRRYLWCFQVTYFCSLLFIKGYICVTLLHIAVVKSHRIIIWLTLIFATLSTSTVIIGLFTICRPISVGWGHPGKCAPTIVIASLGYLVSSGAVVTDWICAALPISMLYRANMKRTTKISISIILGLGSLASLCTIIRFPYVKYYTRTDNYLYNTANIVLWSILESGIGIIAGSLHTLRKLIKKSFVDLDSSTGRSPTHIAPAPTPTPFVGSNRAIITTNSTSTGMWRSQDDTSSNTMQCADGGSRLRLDDFVSGGKIHVTTELKMQTVERPAIP